MPSVCYNGEEYLTGDDLQAEYAADIRSWDWPAMKAEAMSEPADSQMGEDPWHCAFLGTVFALTPSGKYYMPWACSNVTPCPMCGGYGYVGWQAFEVHCNVGFGGIDTATIACQLCEGMGSREALEDEAWSEALEQVAGEHGAFITGGEGDPCDIFAGWPAEEEGEDDDGA